MPAKFLLVPASIWLPESRNPATAAKPSVDSALAWLGVGAQHRTERRRDTLEQLWLDETADLSRLKMRVYAYFSLSFVHPQSPTQRLWSSHRKQAFALPDQLKTAILCVTAKSTGPSPAGEYTLLQCSSMLLASKFRGSYSTDIMFYARALGGPVVPRQRCVGNQKTCQRVSNEGNRGLFEGPPTGQTFYRHSA